VARSGRRSDIGSMVGLLNFSCDNAHGKSPPASLRGNFVIMKLHNVVIMFFAF
jgi:hypothetical protein